jgi:radical SAM superfamily enzyme YgiQ (UPF0313 family)
MRVLLVATNRARFPYAVAPLGAACVASMLRQAGHEVQLLDLCFERNAPRAIRACVGRFKPDAVGLSIRNLDNCSFHHPRAYYDDDREIVAAVRRCTSAEIIAGGSAVSVGGTHLLQHLGVRYGIAGEGEHSFLLLLKAIETGSGFGAIPGLLEVGAAGGSPVVVPPRFDCDLSRLPMNASEGIHYDRYYRTGGFVSIQTKRGCAFRCIYCNYPSLEGACYRLRPPEQCVDDMERIVKDHGLRDFFFVDSVFNVPGDHALAICNEIVRRNLRIRWMAYCNPIGLNREMARVFRQSGCAGVELGLDAATEKMLGNMGKCFSQQDIAASFEALSAEHLPYAVFLLFGGPGESWDDIRETRAFFDRYCTANAVFASLGIRIYENTPMHAISLSEDRITPRTDLLGPTYYVSEELGSRAVETLDELSSQTNTWITPTDWDSLLIKIIQRTAGRLRAIPGWKGVSGYGKHMRRRSRRAKG